MESMIAYCGIDCSACPAFIATMKNDDAEKEKVASLWAKQFGIAVTKENINCWGCKAEGKPISKYCELMCKIRGCARGKSLGTCADCPDFACRQLSEFLLHAGPICRNCEASRSRNRQ